MPTKDQIKAPRLSFDQAQLEQLIEQWYRERINNSVVSRITESVNHVRASVDDLKRRLIAGGTAGDQS